MRDSAPSKTILLLEDDPIVALDLKDQFVHEGYIVMGPFDRVSRAMDALRESKPDIAVLDLHLKDSSCDIVAEQLEAHSIPYAIVTVTAPSMVPRDISPRAVIEKPFDMKHLSALVTSAR
ncbi:response regulator [Dinoroseobacter sp. S375]|uniref:response regulator n=1 Tax=Dinoroseobacter sp. S375 TaxID=3415136 RepID=UPI003C79CFB1